MGIMWLERCRAKKACMSDGGRLQLGPGVLSEFSHEPRASEQYMQDQAQRKPETGDLG